jgi:uncharacterized protein YceH (UPF0502 family)
MASHCRGTAGGTRYRPGVDADAVEIRVLGCLIEKQRTTPDAYPLTLNALRLACNQATNRDPVVEYDEPTIREALARLSRREWVRLASGAGSRAAKYRHLLDQALGLSQADLALLAVLMLRGPQTPGELKQRTERLHAFGSPAEVESALESLLERELAVRLPRRPGQKETRFAQLLGEGHENASDSHSRAEASWRESASDSHSLAPDRVGALEERLGRVEEKLEELFELLDARDEPV